MKQETKLKEKLILLAEKGFYYLNKFFIGKTKHKPKMRTYLVFGGRVGYIGVEVLDMKLTFNHRNGRLIKSKSIFSNENNNHSRSSR